jgi:DNA-binding response OmpR family regulator
MSSPPPAPLPERSNAGIPPTVLLVDDEDAVRAALKRFFARRGWNVVEARDGESAQRLLDPAANHTFDLVICDLSMPRLSGSQLYQWLSRHRPDAVSRLVFSSGDVISRDSSEFLTESGRPILPKPFELAELTRIVDDVYRSAHAA